MPNFTQKHCKLDFFMKKFFDVLWKNNSPNKRKFLTLLILLILLLQVSVFGQIVWQDQLIFKTNQFQKIGEMRGFVLLYSDEQKKMLALDAESGLPIPTQYRIDGNEIFLPVARDKFLQKQVIFVGKKNQNSWCLDILHYTGQEIMPTGPAFELPADTVRILSLNYRNGYIYYLLECQVQDQENSLILQRKHIQCTAIGLPTFSNETSEGFYDSNVDKFLIEPRFEILPDGQDASRDIVLMVGKGRKAPGRIIARIAEWETVASHTIVELPDKNVTISSPPGTNFPILLLNGTRQNGYDLCILGNMRDQTRVFMRRMGEKDLEIEEPESLPIASNNLYSEPFNLQGNWWFPFKTEKGINLVFYTEKQGAVQFSDNFLDLSELYLTPDNKDSSLLYGLSTNSFRKYVLGRSINDWQSYGGFRSVEFGQKSLCSLPQLTAIGCKNKENNDYHAFQIQGIPYKNDSFNLAPIQQLEIIETANKVSQYIYLTTKESSSSFQVNRKYCLSYNSDYRSSAPINTPEAYEYQLIWDTALGLDKNIMGFYIPYQGKNILLVKAVNHLYSVDCNDQSDPRILPFSFGKHDVYDGIYLSDWYKKDLYNLKKIEYLGQSQNCEHFLFITQQNIYQALVDAQGNLKLTEATGITGPLAQISYAALTEDHSTLLCGGLTEQNRAFFAQLYLLPGGEDKIPSFSGITSLYVQNLSEQEMRKPQKILAWGENIFLLTEAGEIEFYEKAQGSFTLAGSIVLDTKILDIALIDNMLCILEDKNIYAIDLKSRDIGVSLQTHFNQQKINASWDYTESPLYLSQYKNILLGHFSKRLLSWNIRNNTLANQQILIEQDSPVTCGFQICPVQDRLYISADNKIYNWSLKNLDAQTLLEPTITTSCNIFKLFTSQDNQRLYYISQEGEIGAIKTTP